MGMFSWLTGNSDAAESAVEAAGSLLDNAFFTDQEKSAASLKMLEFRLRFAEATQHMSISRRIIVVAVTGIWVLTVLVMMGMGIILGKDAASVKFLFETFTDVVNDPFMIIVGFYFLSQVVSKARGNP